VKKNPSYSKINALVTLDIRFPPPHFIVTDFERNIILLCIQVESCMMEDGSLQNELIKQSHSSKNIKLDKLCESTMVTIIEIQQLWFRNILALYGYLS
jgi:hypothetical protein